MTLALALANNMVEVRSLNHAPLCLVPRSELNRSHHCMGKIPELLRWPLLDPWLAQGKAACI